MRLRDYYISITNAYDAANWLSHNRLDKYHLLQKECKLKVEYNVTSKEANLILHILQNIVSDFFYYIETVDELNIEVKHYHQYHYAVRSDLKSEPVCEYIEQVFLAIQNNFQYMAHCYFKDVCTLDFKLDSIANAPNIGSKR